MRIALSVLLLTGCADHIDDRYPGSAFPEAYAAAHVVEQEKNTLTLHLGETRPILKTYLLCSGRASKYPYMIHDTNKGWIVTNRDLNHTENYFVRPPFGVRLLPEVLTPLCPEELHPEKWVVAPRAEEATSCARS